MHKLFIKYFIPLSVNMTNNNEILKLSIDANAKTEYDLIIDEGWYENDSFNDM